MCINPEYILKIKRRQKTLFITVHFSSLAQTHLALADDCLGFLLPSANTSTHLRKSCYFLRLLRSMSPGTKISALIEYFTPHKILRAISGQRREVYFGLLFFFFSQLFSHPTLIHTWFSVYMPGSELLQELEQQVGLSLMYFMFLIRVSVPIKSHFGGIRQLVASLPINCTSRETDFSASPSHHHWVTSPCHHLLETKPLGGDCTKHCAKLCLCRICCIDSDCTNIIK